MSQADNFGDVEFEMAVAAAAYAITSLEEEEVSEKQRSVERLETSRPKTKNKDEEKKINQTSFSGSFKRWFTGKEAEHDGKSAEVKTRTVSGDSFTRKSATEDQMMLEDSTANHNIITKALGTAPSVKKTPTFTDKYLNDTGSKRVESGKEMRAVPNASSTIKPTSLSGYKNQDGNSAKISKAETEADDWEKAQMVKINNRYDKMISTIMEWETEKKAKAKRRMEQKEKGPEQKRAKALQNYRNEISRIGKVAGEARALAKERKRNDEAKTREKAEQIRLTGKLPDACWCF